LSLHTLHTDNQEIYFCIITCYKWLPLIEEAQAYHSVYRWFNYLKNDGYHVVEKIHQVFRLSFDARICANEKMVEQKLDYIHHNPVRGKWNLVDDFVKYPHSSAAFYELGDGIYQDHTL
jgi:hypothetical protein